jgi:predicted TIM-barrel fold metal-dependent hydrolase
MRNGLKVYDSDTHVHASAEGLEPYLSASARKLLPDLDQYKVPIKRTTSGAELEPPYSHRYNLSSYGGGWGQDAPRMLGEAAPQAGGRGRTQKFMGSKLPVADGEWVAASRLRDMDEEGVDVQLMVPGVPRGHSDPAVDEGFIRANHRFLNDFCMESPLRLKALLTLDARFVEGSVEEIKTYGKTPWAVGVWVHLPLDFPMDHPSLNPIWGAVEEEGLCVVHHSFSTGYPGYRDLWENPFIGRTASHPWAAMRAMASFLGAGVMDRYPTLRFSILESGFGWLPFWSARMQDQVEYMGYVPELKQTMNEYLTGGRFFASIVLHEGPEMVKMVSDMMGDHMLMYSSDYPHPETRFPNSVDLVLDWEPLNKDQDLMTKVLWDNAVKCFGEP